jgi:hypothetical protein
VPVLAQHRTQAAHLPHQPLQHGVPPAQIGALKAAGGRTSRPGRPGWRRSRTPLTGAPPSAGGLVDDGRDAVVRADRQEAGFELRAAADVDRLHPVGQAQFFEQRC